MYKVFSLCAILVMAKIWQTFQNKLAKLLEFSLGEKQNPIFLFGKRTLLIYGKWDFFLYVQLCDGENLVNFSKKKKD
jgi:hypothetical protein